MGREVTLERRTEPRCLPPRHTEFTATLRPGCSVALIDVSTHGALVTGARQLRPGSRVQLQITVATGRLSIPARILRCSVMSLNPAGGITYRAGLQFDQPVEWLWS
jgi:hypothetical protein